MANGLSTPAGVSGLDADQLAILLGVKGHCERLLDHSVKKIVTAHHGWVDAKSQNDITDFFIHLPTKAALKKDLGILL
jgi:hypothetical protein